MTTPPTGRLSEGGFNALVPELDVTDIGASLRFWCEGLGFRVAYDRPESGFAYLERGGAQVMLCRFNGNWNTGPLEFPLGRGINFQISVTATAPILDALQQLGWPLFQEPRDSWRRTGDCESGDREFLVQDPDGYLVRLSEALGQRPLSG